MNSYFLTGRRALALALALAAAVPAGAATTIAVYPIGFIDTSNEPGDQDASHARRQQAMATELAAALGQQAGLTVHLETSDAMHAGCPTNDADCQLGLARAMKATVIAVTTVHKVSTLIMNISTRLVDTQGNRTIWARDLSFRDDSDDSWARAGRYLAGEIRDGLMTSLPRAPG